MPNPLGRALRNRRAGHHTLVWAHPDQQASESLTLTSPAFEHGAPTARSPDYNTGKAPRGRRGWAGPIPIPSQPIPSQPIPSHGPHSYVFQLFALDLGTELPDKFSLADALPAMTGHVITRARLDGTYEIP
jgi:hypothetical protein